MPRTPARFTQADINRALRAVQQCEINMRVKLLPDGSIVIEKASAVDKLSCSEVEVGQQFSL